MHNWIKEFPSPITVCDADGIVLEMNDKSAESFEKDGGYNLIGKSLIDCHPEPAKTKLKDMMKAQTKNVYTIVKSGKKKLIFHTPWHENGKYMGFVEISIEIPFEMPNYIRD
jgi:transcriptional regulator with PAS, ATPase and Fis domain